MGLIYKLVSHYQTASRPANNTHQRARLAGGNLGHIWRAIHLARYDAVSLQQIHMRRSAYGYWKCLDEGGADIDYMPAHGMRQIAFQRVLTN
ncbi:hypothetical protein KCP75_18820 [Salmonella enterica subsp. enterica]|nr:hypothetical protein KCP75_18820 [Salmonella enterica subsp. enterica]